MVELTLILFCCIPQSTLITHSYTTLSTMGRFLVGPLHSALAFLLLPSLPSYSIPPLLYFIFVFWLSLAGAAVCGGVAVNDDEMER